MPKVKTARTSASARTGPLKPRSGNTSKKAMNPSEKPATKEPAGDNATQRASRKDCQAGNYLLYIHLTNSYEPSISRLLSVPPETTFDKLHEAIQIAFGWANAHMHQFEVTERNADKPFFGDTLLTLQSSPYDIGIEPEPEQEANYSLADVYDKEEWKGKTLSLMYEYDMGDSWEHQIILLGRADAQLGQAMRINETTGQRIVVLSGEGHGCAEDCGSTPGWENLKDTFKKTRGGDKDLKDWYKHQCVNGDPKGLDPYKWDIRSINEELEQVCQTKSLDSS